MRVTGWQNILQKQLKTLHFNVLDNQTKVVKHKGRDSRGKPFFMPISSHMDYFTGASI